MFKLADLFVQVTGDTKPLNSALLLVQNQLMGMGGLGGRLGVQLAQGLAGPLMGLTGTASVAGVAIGAALAAGAVVGLAKAAMMAGHLTEAINKAEQVFGSSTGKITGLADELASKFGIVKTTVLDTAASFGLMLEGAGVGREKATDMSATLVRLAADAKSFFDVPLEEAIMRIQSGLSGEMEAVRRWGINLTEANVQQKAMALGLFKGKGEMDQATKTAVRYQLIIEGLKPAEGDLERTGGGIVQQWEKLTGQVANIATTVGSIVVPVFTLLLRVTNSILESVGGIVTMWADLAAMGAKMLGLDKLFGFGGADEEAERRAQIDERIKQTEKQFAADSAAGAKHKKGFQGGIEEYAKQVQQSAFGVKDLPKLQLTEQKKTNDILQQIAENLAITGKNTQKAPQLLPF